MRIYPEAQREIPGLAGSSWLSWLFMFVHWFSSGSHARLYRHGCSWATVEISFCLRGYKTVSLPRPSSPGLFSFTACSFADPQGTGISGGLFHFVCPPVCSPLPLLNGFPLPAMRQWEDFRAHLVFGRERTTSKASCYSYQISPRRRAAADSLLLCVALDDILLVF